MDVHPVAAGGFAAAAPSSARSRPTYARQAVGAVKERVPAGSLVVDLAAGTGILAGQLRRAQLRVVAVEPSAEMLEHLVRTLPDVPAVRGVAEALPLGPGAAGAVTVGEAFHWFDPFRALDEIRRVLCDGGLLAVIRNRRDGEAAPSERPEGRRDDRTADLDRLIADTGRFGPGALLEVPNLRPNRPYPELVGSASFELSHVTELWTWTAT